jgi:hypothetical protein
MRKFKLINPNFKGSVMFGFNIDGLLTFYDVQAELNATQIKYMLPRLPFVIEDFPRLTEGTAFVVEELPPDLSFEAFWSILEPRNKINKKRCLAIWESLNDANRMLAIVRYKDYIAHCRSTGRYVADPENYLKRELYLTDWRVKK